MAARRKFTISDADAEALNFEAAQLDGWFVEQIGSRYYAKNELGRQKGPYLLESDVRRAVPNYTFNRPKANMLARLYGVKLGIRQHENNTDMRVVTFDERHATNVECNLVSVCIVSYVVAKIAQETHDALETANKVAIDVHAENDAIDGDIEPELD